MAEQTDIAALSVDDRERLRYVRPGKLRVCNKCKIELTTPDMAFYQGMRTYCSPHCATLCLGDGCSAERHATYKTRCVACGIARQRKVAGTKFCKQCNCELQRGLSRQLICASCRDANEAERESAREATRKIERKNRLCKSCSCILGQNYRHFCDACRKQRAVLSLRKSAKIQKVKRRMHMGAEFSFSDADWQSVLEYFGHRCAYCMKSATKLERDHFEPISKGGAHTVANIVPACRSCNASKHDKTALMWLLHKASTVEVKDGLY